MPTAFRLDRFSHCEGRRIEAVTYHNCLGFDNDAAGSNWPNAARHRLAMGAHVFRGAHRDQAHRQSITQTMARPYRH